MGKGRFPEKICIKEGEKEKGDGKEIGKDVVLHIHTSKDHKEEKKNSEEKIRTPGKGSKREKKKEKGEPEFYNQIPDRNRRSTMSASSFPIKVTENWDILVEPKRSFAMNTSGGGIEPVFLSRIPIDDHIGKRAKDRPKKKGKERKPRNFSVRE